MKYPGDTANMFTTMILQLIFKIMVKEKILTPSQAFHHSYLAPVTQALLTYFLRLWDTVHMYAEDNPLTFLRPDVLHVTVQKIYNSGLQKVASRADFQHLHSCHTLGIKQPSTKKQAASQAIPSSSQAWQTSSSVDTQQQKNSTSSNTKKNSSSYNTA